MAIQRWDLDYEKDAPEPLGWDSEGRFVLYADHLAVVKWYRDALQSYAEFVDKRNTIDEDEFVIYKQARAVLAEAKGEPCK